MREDLLIPLLRNAHILSFLVRQILEDGYLRRAGCRASFLQMNVLKCLSLPGPHTVTSVARFLSVSQPAATKVVARLRKLRLIRSVAAPGDRRIELLGLTAEGKKEIRRYEKLKMARLAALLADEDDNRLRDLVGHLEHLIGTLLKEREFVGNFCARCGAYYAPECIGKGSSCPLRMARDLTTTP